jgi:hypothetical protein
MAGRSPGHLRFDGGGWMAGTRPAMTGKGDRCVSTNLRFAVDDTTAERTMKPPKRPLNIAFVGAQTGVIEGVAPTLPNAFAMSRPAIKHQHGQWRGMVGEHLEHPPMVIWLEMKKAIPSEHVVKLTVELQRPHVLHQPIWL